MKKLIPCMLAGFILIGLFSLCITSFLAPSANYIQDTVEPSEEPFYFILNPVSQTVHVGDSFSLSAYTNLSGCSYSWQYLSYSFDVLNGRYEWRNSEYPSFDGTLFRDATQGTFINFYRCVARVGDRVIYSAPATIISLANNSKSVNSYNDSILSEEKSLFLPDIDSVAEFEELEKTEDFEESEVIE